MGEMAYFRVGKERQHLVETRRKEGVQDEIIGGGGVSKAPGSPQWLKLKHLSNQINKAAENLIQNINAPSLH